MDELGILSIAIIVSVVVGCIWGAITHAIQNSKGYYESGFWWGFWLGWIGIIVVLCKPDMNQVYYSQHRSDGQSPAIMDQPVPKDGWRCTCGRTHASFVSACVCGISKSTALAPAKPAPVPVQETEPEYLFSKETESEKIAALRQYKELLDQGILTREEFDAKKKQLLS